MFVILYRPELGDYEKTLNRIDLYENYFLTASQNFIFIKNYINIEWLILKMAPKLLPKLSELKLLVKMNAKYISVPEQMNHLIEFWSPGVGDSSFLNRFLQIDSFLVWYRSKFSQKIQFVTLQKKS